MKRKCTVCSIVVPFYNEEDVVREFHTRLAAGIVGLACEVELIYVDDGSTDHTLDRLNEIAEHWKGVVVVSLSRNFGHQAALSAGLECARGDAVITMDGDGEHPPELILEMISLYELGYDVVLGQRRSTKGLPISKRVTSRLFYKVINLLSETEMVVGVADFRLLSGYALECLNRMPERKRFLRGMVSWMGFPTVVLPFEQKSRLAGRSKYTMARMFHLARDAIFSFSTVPLRLALLSGGIVLILALLEMIDVVFVLLTRGPSALVPGWTSIMLGILIIGGAQLVAIGLQGYYIGMIFQEVKQRPPYLLREPVQRLAGKSTRAQARLDASDSVKIRASFSGDDR